MSALAGFDAADFVKFGRKTVCVGRNYAEHAKELNNAVPDTPLLFLKPPSAYLPHWSAEPIRIPKGATVHHEVELGVVIGQGGTDINEKWAMQHVAGYCLALDLTARDIQEAAKKKGTPWTVAKGYDTFTPIGGFIPKSEISDPHNVRLWCKVDGVMKQDGNTEDMIFSIEHLISHISSIMTLEKGDVILTGTPAGVGPILPGQDIECGLTEDDKYTMMFTAVER
ncbi:fumarylacetoacetate hydrolase domain-containing protein 1 [Sphaeroforma arctica JP610]|uniref:Fumarylacetoacetate hydrolase domain-containing protein 1 n=1 Tax=Sphaeroforma arctica JP610 TaxID=667725 RepID=A0A0L0FHT0_9EUKA|nr:fumarylacetoacetate hydrolase domain-containing protein 1 [Sphaeroforma arctica JP610]KNC76344.1 fumarylacetoacetate hydrolase domain-containing protein 1 [Sphaeroforma arctica JP610]|eukprot:XP_014150246.1 fumarylacetoacetate hydrolase domain-containing protein 1 [Sphaeroforma arctica JP610]